MSNGTDGQDLRDLVDQPKETLSIEIKSNLDLSTIEHRADLARQICALANHGGGYIVFGFSDNLLPVPIAGDVHSLYGRDAISSIVATFLTPALLCDVAYVTSSNGLVHPVVSVPGHGTVPVCAKKNGPNGPKGRPEGIEAPFVYIRVVGPNGPESAKISRPEDWEKLIRRCVIADRTVLLGMIENLMLPLGARAGSAPEPLKRWHDAARRRFLTLVDKTPPQWPTSLVANHFALSYMINCSTPERLQASSMIEALQSANAQTRQLVSTGWSMFYPFNRAEIAPYFVTDEASGQGEGDILEASLLGAELLEGTLPDFWRVSVDGKASLLRAYREDRVRQQQFGLAPGERFSPFLLVREIAELCRHARAMAERFPSVTSVAFRCEWFGLKGRQIADSDADISKQRIARTEKRSFSNVWPIADLSARWPVIVSEVSSAVTRLFDAELEMTPEWIQSVESKFRSL
jgi:Putative DNA-binding domain